MAPSRLGDPVERGKRLGKGALAEIAARDGDAQTVDAHAQAPAASAQRRTIGAGRIVGVGALHHVIG